VATTFDGPNKVISFSVSTTTVDVRDIYSDWVDWFLTSDNSKFMPAMRNVGGDLLPGSKTLGLTYFMLNGWKIKPFEENHTVTFNGNLYSEDGSSPYMSVVGSYQVMVISSVSNLVDSTVAQLAEIEYASFNGGVAVDPLGGVDGVAYPAGTAQSPVQTCDSVMTVAEARGFHKVYVLNDFSIADHVMSGYELQGLNHRSTQLILDNITWAGGKISNCELTGTFANGSSVEISNCEIVDLYNITIDAHDCYLGGTIELNDSLGSVFTNCFDIGGNSPIPILQVNDCENLAIRGYTGRIKLTNITTVGSQITVDLRSGRLVVDSSDTEGSIIVTGIGTVEGATGGTTIDQSGLINISAIAEVGGSLTVDQDAQLMKTLTVAKFMALK
jgi:hypothetical protein